MKYLTFEDILIIAKDVCSSSYLQNENSLSNLIATVNNEVLVKDPYPTLAEKAALYIHRIIANHIFNNGCKRTAFKCAFLFLKLNDCPVPKDEEIDEKIINLGLKIAKKCITDIKVIAEHIQSWILQKNTDI